MSSNRRNLPGCFLPMNALSIHPQGQTHFCLTSTLPPPRNNQELNDARLSIHQELLAGGWPESCQKCRNKENKGLESRRVRTLIRKEKQYGHEKLELFLEESTSPAVRHLDISFSNVCNLSCAMCSSEFSTGWRVHDRQALSDGLEFRNFTKGYDAIKKISPEILDYVYAHLDEIDVLIIKGGEPTKEPLCLDFLKTLALKENLHPSIFIQSNGTTAPSRWLQGLENLDLEVGISIDGWDNVFNWIRGPYFDEVLKNLEDLHQFDNIKLITIDFTLSAFNVLHLPEFLKRVIELKNKFPKIKQCPVFQWAQQPYATALNLPLHIREQILSECLPVLKQEAQFFLDHEFLISLLKKEQAPKEFREQTLQWIKHINKMRHYDLGSTARDLELALKE